MRRFVILLILLPVVLVGTIIARVLLVPVTAAENDDALRTQLRRDITGLMEMHGVPGVAIALIHDGEVWVQGYGSEDTRRGPPVTADTVFQAASVSKSVSAWGVMRLVEQGKLGLDVPVSRYLTRWHLPQSPFDSDGVTVRRLLSHTSGLSVSGYLGYEPGVALLSLEKELSIGPDAAERPGAVRIIYPPGEAVHYSGGGYTLLQLLVEEESNQSFADYMQRQVLAPLGMTQSTFEWSPRIRESIATPYGKDGNVLPQYRFLAKAAGGLYTTATDLARFVAATMERPGAPRGRGVLAPETLDLMLSSAPAAKIAMGPIPVGSKGLGYAIDPVLLGRGAPVVGHDGSNQGWKTAFLALPPEGEGMVILTNSEGGRALNEEVKCAWVGWATGRTTPPCMSMHLTNDALIATGIWLALVVAVGLRARLTH